MHKILDELQFLFERYAVVKRAMAQTHRIDMLKERFPDFTYNPEDDLVRESLLEHVGNLPILATTLYPHIDDDSVDLGSALTMLAIHDIGETITGDEPTFTKQEDAHDNEYKQALKLLHPMYHAIFDDIEHQTSSTGKFAKSIDKIAPDIMEFFSPAEITIPRMKHFANVERDEIVPLVVKHKRKFMLWNPFLTEFHAFLMNEQEKKLQAAKM